MGRALAIGGDLGAAALRALAARTKRNHATRRMPAIANSLEGMSRASAARAAGMDRQALRDAVVRYDAEGLDGLYDRPTSGRPPARSEAELALLSARIFRGPDPETDGVRSCGAAVHSQCTVVSTSCSQSSISMHAARIEDRFDKRPPPRSLSRILRREGFSRQKTRSTHPKTDEQAQRRFEKGGSSRRWRPPPRPIAASGRRSGFRTRCAMRVGRKGRLRHRWRTKGERPPGVQDQRHPWACLFGAARPGGEDAFAPVLPVVNTDTMQLFLDRFAETPAEDEHAVMILDGAGWRGARALAVPPNVALAPLPPYSPQLDPMERVWLHLRERFLSLRVLEAYDAVVGPCRVAWNAIADDAGRLGSPCLYPWIQKVIG